MGELLKKCEEYVEFIWHMGNIGAVGLYGAEEMRVQLHEEICELAGIDHKATKAVTDNLPIDFNKEPSGADIERIAKIMVDEIADMRGEA